MPASQAVDVPSSRGGDLSPNGSFVNYGHSIDAHIFQMRQMEAMVTTNEPDKEDGLPVDLLPGEEHEESAELHQATLYITKHRIIVVGKETKGIACVPVTNIDTVNSRGNYQIDISCKEGRIIRLAAQSTEQARTWYAKIMQRAYCESDTSRLFLWSFAAANQKAAIPWLSHHREHDAPTVPDIAYSVRKEFDRFELDCKFFRIDTTNSLYKICPSYPREFIVPSALKEEEVSDSASFRFGGRLPVVVWHSTHKHVTLLRASQPRAGLLFWRNGSDQKLVKAVNDYTRMKRGEGAEAGTVILDARSYNAATGNRIKGGGFENVDYYDCCTVEFFNLPNIHSVRTSFLGLKELLTPPVEQSSFLLNLQNTNWFTNLALLLKQSAFAVHLLLDEGRNVLVHCSDGWDRTAQLVSLIKIIADPYYRTFEGMEELVRLEWVALGHKFADRHGIGCNVENERAPVFVQFLDAVHQLYLKYTGEFEFSSVYLVKLAQHAHSGLFTTFSFNCLREMEEASSVSSPGLPNKPGISVWQFLNKSNESLANKVYSPVEENRRLKVPEGVQSLQLWNFLYNCSEAEALIMAHNLTANPAVQPSVHDESRGLMKSKSSESLSSSAVDTSYSLLTPSYRPSRPPSHGIEHEQHEVECRVSGVVRREDGPAPPSKRLLHTLVDVDGLVRVIDPLQEAVRRLNKKEELRVQNETVRLSRRRITSELTDHSGSSSDKMILEDTFGMDSETDSLHRALSDTSIVDSSEVSAQPGRAGPGFALHQPKCALCHTTFNRITLINPHHCKSCGRQVCANCSGHHYHDVLEGWGQQKRACDSCYQSMSTNPDSLSHSPSSPSAPPSESSSATTSARQRGTSSSHPSCPDSEGRQDARAVGMLSQAVKG